MLALDTSSPAVTAALADEHQILAQSTIIDAHSHGEQLAPRIREVLTQAGLGISELTAIAVGVGPGPFTGLRVGLASALALSDALDIPSYGVCSLDIMAWEYRAGPCLVASDARRKEVYWASYDATGRCEQGPHVCRPQEVPPALTALPTLGQGPQLYPEFFAHPQGPQLPSAAALAELVRARLANAQGLLPLQPLYLRQPDAVPIAAAAPQ